MARHAAAGRGVELGHFPHGSSCETPLTPSKVRKHCAAVSPRPRAEWRPGTWFQARSVHEPCRAPPGPHVRGVRAVVPVDHGLPESGSNLRNGMRRKLNCGVVAPSAEAFEAARSQLTDDGTSETSSRRRPELRAARGSSPGALGRTVTQPSSSLSPRTANACPFTRSTRIFPGRARSR
jgi:hypothetical protein